MQSGTPLGQVEPADVFACGHTFVGGERVRARSGAEFTVHRPCDGAVLGRAPDMGGIDAKLAVDAAAAAFCAWARQPAKVRADALHRWAALLELNSAQISRIVCNESGKPIREARAEAAYAIAYVRWFAEEARRAYGEIIPTPSSDRRLLVTKHPIGVVAAITPWNFPFAMITRKCAPALAAGCTVVVKPSELTPFTAIAAAQLARAAGMPPGALNIVTGMRASEIAGVLTSDSRVRKLSFTGSTPVGALLAAQCAGQIKRLSLELGGNAPFIVFDDARLDNAVQGLIAAKFRNAGQTCVCANRVLVHASVYEDFAERVERAVRALRVGHNESETTDIGALINIAAVDKVERHINDAVRRGAQVTVGGKRHPAGRCFHEPTVLRDVSSEALLCQEETFGPLVGLVPFGSEEEALALANGTPFGLAAYLYTESYRRIVRFSERLEIGMLAINSGVLSTEVAPFGGVKMSGYGREGSHHGLDEYLDVRYLCLAGLDETSQP